MKPTSTKHFVLIFSAVLLLVSSLKLYNFGYNYAKRHLEIKIVKDQK